MFLQMPFSTETETSTLFGLILVVHFTVLEIHRTVHQYFYQERFTDSGVIFYLSIVTVIIIVRKIFLLKWLVNMFRAATIGGLQGQETKTTIMVSILCTVIIVVIFFGFRDFVDINIRHEFQR